MNPLRQAFFEATNLDPWHDRKAFEKVLGLILKQEDIRHVLSYKPSGEEIDGDFLVEHIYILV